eukprot:7377795-Prymnesium_polylepis.3
MPLFADVYGYADGPQEKEQRFPALGPDAVVRRRVRLLDGHTLRDTLGLAAAMKALAVVHTVRDPVEARVRLCLHAAMPHLGRGIGTRAVGRFVQLFRLRILGRRLRARVAAVDGDGVAHGFGDARCRVDCVRGDHGRGGSRLDTTPRRCCRFGELPESCQRHRQVCLGASGHVGVDARDLEQPAECRSRRLVLARRRCCTVPRRPSSLQRDERDAARSCMSVCSWIGGSSFGS